MKRLSIAAAAAALGCAGLAGLVATAPASAGASEAPAPPDREPSEAEVAEAMRAIFKVEPLTAEQRARLPQAEAVIARMMPPGTLQQMMGGMYDKMPGPLIDLGAEADSADVARELGVEGEDLELADEDAARIAAMLDPRARSE